MNEEKEIKIVMEHFDLNENQAKIWIENDYEGKDNLIKNCWEEAQKELLIQLKLSGKNKWYKTNKTKIISLKEIEYLMDKANGEHGTKKAYCLFCGSNKYNSLQGIIHKDNCIIKRLRNEIKNEK